MLGCAQMLVRRGGHQVPARFRLPEGVRAFDKKLNRRVALEPALQLAYQIGPRVPAQT
jgi:hypothetical protein